MNLNRRGSSMKKKTLLFLSALFAFTTISYGAQASVVERQNWFLNDTNTTMSSSPTNLKFFKQYDLLPDEIALELFKEKEMAALAGKRIFVGYGVVDPTGTDCRVFEPSSTGMDQNVTVCLPWWRIERDYQLSASTTTDFEQFFCTMPQPRPPKLVNVCSAWEAVSPKYDYPGGKVTCTSYYNKLLSKECWENPKQPACFMNNCSDYVKKNCTATATVGGDVTTLQTTKYSSSTGDKVPVAFETKLDVLTYQYQCPAGSLVPNQKCVAEKSVLMFPHECKVDNPATLVDDGEYTYCDEKQAQYDGAGAIVGFLGNCADGRQVMCEANGLSETKMECLAPKYAEKVSSELRDTFEARNYTEKSIDVLSGEPDIYSENATCVRSNTIADSRDREIYIKILGSGYLDDDIFVMRHTEEGTHIKQYCNMQHGGASPTRMYDGNLLSCIQNNGNYSFNSTIKINASDIVTIHQASENIQSNPTPFSIGRNHYRSTKVTIDDVLVVPDISVASHPFYPSAWSGGMYLKTWDNTLGSLAIMFPFSGSYMFQFFNKDGGMVGQSTIGIEEFEQVSEDGNYQLRLGKSMILAPGITAANACIEDDFVELGGGVFGGRGSKSGAPCASPNDAYVIENAIHTIIVRDLLTGSLTTIPLVYPLAYPNSIFISKLNVYEKRKYRCYNNFSTAIQGL